MTLVLIPEPVLRELMGKIVAATHSLQQQTGAPAIIETIDPEALRSSALVALTVATHHTVLPIG